MEERIVSADNTLCARRVALKHCSCTVHWVLRAASAAAFPARVCITLLTLTLTLLTQTLTLKEVRFVFGTRKVPAETLHVIHAGVP